MPDSQRVEREGLIKVLERVSPGLAQKEVMDAMVRFTISNGAITTYNDLICVHHPFDLDIRCSVKATRFHRVLQKLYSKEVEMGLDEDMRLVVTDETTELKVPVTIESELLEKVDGILKDAKDLEFKKLPKDFMKAIKLCMISVGKSETYMALTCINVTSMGIASGDGIRISFYELDEGLDPFMVKARLAKELIRFSDIDQFAVSDNWVHFKNPGGVIFSVRRVADCEFPEFESHLVPTSTEIELTKDVRNDIKKALDTVIVMITEDDNMKKKTKVNISREGFQFLVDGKEGEIRKIVRTVVNVDEDIQFIINPIFLRQIMDEATSFFAEKNKIIIKSGNFKHALYLIKGW